MPFQSDSNCDSIGLEHPMVGTSMV